MINNVIIAGSILMYICVFFTTFDYGNLLPEALDNHICMVGSDLPEPSLFRASNLKTGPLYQSNSGSYTSGNFI